MPDIGIPPTYDQNMFKYLINIKKVYSKYGFIFYNVVIWQHTRYELNQIV